MRGMDTTLGQRIGANVERARLAAKLSQSEVARRLRALAKLDPEKYSPVTQPTISRIEGAGAVPTVPTLVSLAHVLKVPTSALLDGCDELLATVPPTQRAAFERAIRGDES